jgi:N-acetylmuramoyl-L-alanine amidase
MVLSPGDSGETVRQLQRRLGAAGFLSFDEVVPGSYDMATESAVRAFQSDRGLEISGVCDDTTLQTLVEAAWELGDRPLSLRSPNLRGDDVAELQRLLSRLGFDCGRIDGIFGQLAHRAVTEFQTNAGADVTGICSTETIGLLRLLSRQTGDGPGISSVKEAESLRFGTPLAGKRVVVGQFGGYSTLAADLVEALRDHGALVMSSDDPDPVSQAASANDFGAELYIGLEAVDERRSMVTYYQVPAFESATGRTLARLIERHLRDVLHRPTVAGMRRPVLRETKMPAVLLTLGPEDEVVARGQRVAKAIYLALTALSS